MIRAPLSISSVLDEATEAVAATATPWSGILLVAVLPYRLMQVLFFDRLFEVGGDAARYGNLLRGTAYWTIIAFVLALLGRLVYARACRLTLARGTRPGAEAWRVPAAAIVSYVLTATGVAFFGWMMAFTIAGVWIAAMVAGLAIGTAELNERVGVLAPFRVMFRYAKSIGITTALAFVFTCAFVIAYINVGAAFMAGAWLLSAVGGFDAPRWMMLFSIQNRTFLLLIGAGALLAIEPFWIASHVAYVRKAGAEESGDDIRAWFEELRRAS